MNEEQALAKLIPPGQPRPWKKANRQGIIQIIVTTSCDLACPNCTQLANIKRPHWEMTPEHFDVICRSLEGYFGVVALFGGNPCLAKNFPEYCRILTGHFPREQRGLWSNNLFKHGPLCRDTFGPHNLNVHGSQDAYDTIRNEWPEAKPFGLDKPSRHAPVFVSMAEIGIPEDLRWKYIANCDLNFHWSGAATVVNDQPVGFFCEVAAAQAIYLKSTTGIFIHPDDTPKWWEMPMSSADGHDFSEQARFHCHNCAVPLKGQGTLDSGDTSHISARYAEHFHPKRGGAKIIHHKDEILPFSIDKVTNYQKHTP